MPSLQQPTVPTPIFIHQGSDQLLQSLLSDRFVKCSCWIILMLKLLYWEGIYKPWGCKGWWNVEENLNLICTLSLTHLKKWIASEGWGGGGADGGLQLPGFCGIALVQVCSSYLTLSLSTMSLFSLSLPPSSPSTMSSSTESSSS